MTRGEFLYVQSEKTMSRLQNKTAPTIGGTSGIGLACALWDLSIAFILNLTSWHRARTSIAATLGILAAVHLAWPPGALAQPLDQHDGNDSARDTVQVYASPAVGEGGSVNTYIIDTGNGVLVFDPQRLRPETERVIQLIGDREVLAVFASHPHSDHYAGLAVFAERFPNAVRISGPETRRAVAEDANGFNAARRECHGKRFPSQAELTAAAPNYILQGGKGLTFGGETFEAMVFGLGHAEEHIALYHPATGSLFAGDLVVNEYVPVSWGDIDDWIDQLQELKARFPDARTVYVGHGPPGPAIPLIDAQIGYLTQLRNAAAAALKADGHVDEDEKAQIVFDLELKSPHRMGAGGRDRRATLSSVVMRVAEQLGGTSADSVGAIPSRTSLRPADDIGTVTTYVSPALDVDAVNAHLVTTPEGLVVIDAQRLSTDAERLVRLIGDRPVAAIVITHGHTDHYGGLPILRRAFPDAPVWSGAETLEGIRADSRGFNAMRRDRHGERFPTQRQLTAAAPDHVVENGQTLELGGTIFIAAVYGPSEAEEHLVLYHPETRGLFTGDLVNHGVIPVPFEDLNAWLKQLDDLEQRFPDAMIVHPGHGKSGAAAELIDANRAYLLHLREKITAALAGDSLVTLDEKSEIILQLELAYPHHIGVAGFDRRALLSNIIDRVAGQYGGTSEGAVDWNAANREQGE